MRSAPKFAIEFDGVVFSFLFALSACFEVVLDFELAWYITRDGDDDDDSAEGEDEGKRKDEGRDEDEDGDSRPSCPCCCKELRARARESAFQTRLSFLPAVFTNSRARWMLVMSSGSGMR